MGSVDSSRSAFRVRCPALRPRAEAAKLPPYDDRIVRIPSERLLEASILPENYRAHTGGTH